MHREVCAAPSNTLPARTPRVRLDFLLLWKTSPQCGEPRPAAVSPVPSRECSGSSSPRLPRTCRSRGWEDAVVPVGRQTGGAERSFSSNACSLQTLVYPQQAWWVPRRWQPCSLDQLLRSFPTTQLLRKPLSKPFSSKNNLYKYFPKQTRPTVRYSPKKLSKAGARLY